MPNKQIRESDNSWSADNADCHSPSNGPTESRESGGYRADWQDVLSAMPDFSIGEFSVFEA